MDVEVAYFNLLSPYLTALGGQSETEKLYWIRNRSAKPSSAILSTADKLKVNI